MGVAARGPRASGVELHDGVAVDAVDFIAGDPPRVMGAGGIAADLVIDGRGPRSTSDPWLEAIGARPVPEELHESGIVYFSRFYRLTGAADARPRRTWPRSISAT